ALLDAVAGRALVDLAHASPRTFDEVLEGCQGTVVVSHAGCHSVHPHRRNLGDAQMESLAQREGVIGIPADPSLIDSTHRRIERVADHVEHAIDVMGAEYVGLGGDFLHQIAVSGAMSGGGWRPRLSEAVRRRLALRGLSGPQHYQNLAYLL